MTLILALASATILLTVITLLVLVALWRKKFRTEGGVSQGESASMTTATGQQSTSEDEVIPTDKSPPINNVRWASVYSYDLAVGCEVEDDSSDDGAKMRKSTLLIHISPDIDSSVTK